METGLISRRQVFPSLSSFLEADARFGSPEGPPIPHSPEEIWDHWIGLFRRRVREKWDNVIQVTGPPRCGKSTLVLRLAQGVDPTLTADTLPERMAATGEEMIHLYDTLDKGQAAIYDEAIRGQQSTEFSTAESRMLVQIFNTAGVRRLTLFLLIPHRMDMNKATRDRRVEFWIKCARRPRGRAFVHKRADIWDYDDPRWSGLSLDHEWSPLEWKPLDGTRLWRVYEQEKERRLKVQFADSLARSRAEHAYVDDFKVREELEKEIRKRLDQGQGRRQIHDELGISPNTISRVSQKMQLEKLKQAGYRGPADGSSP